MKQEKINYQDVMDLGFKRKDEHDPVFVKQNGYDWFIVTKKLAKGIYLDWDSETKFVQLIRHKKGFIKTKYNVKNLAELKMIDSFFTHEGEKLVVNPTSDTITTTSHHFTQLA